MEILLCNMKGTLKLAARVISSWRHALERIIFLSDTTDMFHVTQGW